MKVLWLQSGGCGGCTMSLLCAENPGLLDTLSNAGIELLWHPSLSEASGAAVITLLEQLAAGSQPLDVLCVEGSILRGPNGTGAFHQLAGTNTAMLHWVQRLAEKAQYTLAIGSCAAFGGITAGGCNPTDACGLQYDGHLPGGALGKDYRARSGLPVINVAGCPTHPGWITETLLLLALQGMQPDELDSFARPRFYSDHLAHHGCSRNEYYEYKASAEKPSDLGCMMEHMGCLGTQAHADCNLRLWNGQGSCTRAGYACINCTAPEFEEPGHPFLHTPNIAGIPIGLPTDMPKAWFVALASLSKAATPKRVRENAQADHIVVQPGKKK
ncbi:MAG TPA: HupU protein [Candidatus Thiothrix moscowensis]|uniref:NADH-quinone oxidoreductase subunit B family protein n=1 Tax=unclassified Thiothrix TaxID=2636184 RepID=UPI0025E63951|nr:MULTISPECIES: HupU protein [unclassified Thiothrix]HRJ51752.1 HupU protein [Candidatus Thiothrix moscowensis]HRJ92067.1 HupU protein [Candidatus Thiothrix moscowensis]